MEGLDDRARDGTQFAQACFSTSEDDAFVPTSELTEAIRATADSRSYFAPGLEYPHATVTPFLLGSLLP